MWTEIKALPYKVFFIKDLVDRKEIVIEYYPTGDMVADFFTKPLQGELFRELKNVIMEKVDIATFKE